MYELEMIVDNDSRNNVLFCELESINEVLNIVNIFEAHCNTLCNYTISYTR